MLEKDFLKVQNVNFLQLQTDQNGQRYEHLLTLFVIVCESNTEGTNLRNCGLCLYVYVCKLCMLCVVFHLCKI